MNITFIQRIQFKNSSVYTIFEMQVAEVFAKRLQYKTYHYAQRGAKSVRPFANLQKLCSFCPPSDSAFNNSIQGFFSPRGE